MAQPIRVDNSRPATVRDTARILGVSKKRTDQLIRLAKGMIYRDPKTGKVVIRTGRSGKLNGRTRSRNAVAKAHKTNSTRTKAR